MKASVPAFTEASGLAVMFATVEEAFAVPSLKFQATCPRNADDRKHKQPHRARRLERMSGFNQGEDALSMPWLHGTCAGTVARSALASGGGRASAAGGFASLG